MGRRAGYYIDPIRFLERQVRRDEGMDEEVRQYGLGLLSWWAEWADEYELELPEREVVSDIVRAHLGGAGMKPDAMTRARILGSADKAVRGLRQRMRGRRKLVPGTQGRGLTAPPIRRVERQGQEQAGEPAEENAAESEAAGGSES